MSALHVVFKVGGSDYALPAAEVVCMESFVNATHVPGVAHHVAGLVQIRGRVVPVVDLRARFGLPAVERSLDHRVIVVQSGPRTIGLLVDSAREVLNIPASDQRPPPDVVVSDGAGFVRSVAQIGPRLVMLVDFRKLIGEEKADGER